VSRTVYIGHELYICVFSLVSCSECLFVSCYVSRTVYIGHELYICVFSLVSCSESLFVYFVCVFCVLSLISFHKCLCVSCHVCLFVSSLSCLIMSVSWPINIIGHTCAFVARAPRLCWESIWLFCGYIGDHHRRRPSPQETITINIIGHPCAFVAGIYGCRKEK